MTFAKACALRDSRIASMEANLRGYDDTWISLEVERPYRDEWVETALEIDGEIVPQDQGYIGHLQFTAYRSEDAPFEEEWPVTHWRYPEK